MLEQASSVEEREQRRPIWTLPSGGQRRSNRAVIARLIRRLRISDSPQHFQTVATTVLRTSLELSAVAWIPKDPHDPRLSAAPSRGLNTAAYRGLSVAGRPRIDGWFTV